MRLLVSECNDPLLHETNSGPRKSGIGDRGVFEVGSHAHISLAKRTE